MDELVRERKPSQQDPNCEGSATTRALCSRDKAVLHGVELNMARGFWRRLENGLGGPSPCRDLKHNTVSSSMIKYPTWTISDTMSCKLSHSLPCILKEKHEICCNRVW